MTLLEAIKARHSVRNYKGQDIIDTFKEKIADCNILGDIRIQLVTDDPKAL